VCDDVAEFVKQTKQGTLFIFFDDRNCAVARMLAESEEVGMWQHGALMRQLTDLILDLEPVRRDLIVNMLKTVIFCDDLDNLFAQLLNAGRRPVAGIAGGSQERGDAGIGLLQAVLIKTQILLAGV